MFSFRAPLTRDGLRTQSASVDGTNKDSTPFERTVVPKSRRFRRVQFSLVRHDLSATFETGLNDGEKFV